MGTDDRFAARSQPMLNDYPLSERKLVYRVLHRHLAEHPELMDARLLDDLQQSLQSEARAAGVDVTDHQAWDRWLGNESVGCDVRNAHRQAIP
jgi:hypothetical protein